MKRYLVLAIVVFFLGFSQAFAGADTDAICSDDSKQGLIYENIQVSYPNESVSVDKVWKTYYSLNPLSLVSTGSYKLYYIVNIRGKSEYSSNVRAELYVYDCDNKKPKQLISTNIESKMEDYYTVDYLKGGNLIIVGRASGMMDGPTHTIIVYNIFSNRKLFTIKDTSNVLSEGLIRGFVSGKGAWYLYIDLNYSDKGELYRIDKKTYKITKL